MRRQAFAWSVVVSVSLALAGAAHAADNWIGTWKLNAAKTKTTNAIRAQTLTFEATADGVKLSSEGTDAEGKPMKGGYTSKFDGMTLCGPATRWPIPRPRSASIPTTTTTSGRRAARGCPVVC